MYMVNKSVIINAILYGIVSASKCHGCEHEAHDVNVFDMLSLSPSVSLPLFSLTSNHCTHAIAIKQ